jgi:redox-sensing transcriptional repressor
MDNLDFNKIMSEGNEYADGERNWPGRSDVSPAVIKRLPRYFRYLRELIRNGKTRISSGELSEIMHVTASQIRQDLNCFGGFGQQGYGYNVNYLYAKICDILGVGMGFCGIIIGAGNLGTALIKNPMFEKRGVDIIAMFDVDPTIVGKVIAGIEVFHMNDLERFCKNNRVDIAALTLPKELAQEAAEQAVRLGIRGLWNFTGKEFYFDKDIAVENVHLGDSLMTLCYELCHINQRTGEQSDED